MSSTKQVENSVATHTSLFCEVAVLYTKCSTPSAAVHGTTVTVTLNSDRLQARCLEEEGKEGDGD